MAEESAVLQSFYFMEHMKMDSDSRKRNIIERFLDLKLTQKLVILLDLFFWFICIMPVISVVSDCIDGATNGVVPWISSFGNDAVEKIYGIDAVKDILSFYFGFLFVGVLMWIFWLIFTIGFTSYAMACTHYRKPQLYTDEGGFLHMVGEEDEQS